MRRQNSLIRVDQSNHPRSDSNFTFGNNDGSSAADMDALNMELNKKHLRMSLNVSPTNSTFANSQLTQGNSSKGDASKRIIRGPNALKLKMEILERAKEELLNQQKFQHSLREKSK